MNSNPISLHYSGRITDAQLNSCNTLLTQLASIVDQLEKLVSPINHRSLQDSTELKKTDSGTPEASLSKQKQIAIDHKKALLDPLQANWHCLLMDLKTVVLPEFYVVFNDPTTLASARRRLYDVTQAIYYALKRYLDAALYAHDAVKADKKSNSTETTGDEATDPLSPQFLKPVFVPDSYVSRQGKNAAIAAELYELAQFVDVDGMQYIEQFDPYYSALIELNNLEALLQAHSQKTLVEQLARWQQARLTSFGVISEHTQFQHPSILNSKLNHNLAKWLLSEVLDLSYPPAPLAVIQPVHDELIIKPAQFKKGAALSLVGAGSAALVGIGPLFGVVMFLVSTSAAIMSSKLLFQAVNFRRYHDQIGTATTYAMWISFFGLFLGMPWTFMAIYVLCIASWTKTYNRNQQASRLNQLTVANHSKKTSNQAARKPPRPIDPTHTLSLNIHAYHLGLLLSDEATERLTQLLVATNELNDHLKYLQSTYPYLATRVRELVTDLTQNTIARLDELASRFVEDGAVNPEVQALFIRQHETRIDELIALNLKQVNDLNTTILEKKMAVFDDVGNRQERPFRNAIMELKILLRWLIAQQPDELQASSHQVILDNLETSTLKDMQATFFDNHTNHEQRAALLAQVETLLAHFKQQSPFALNVNSGHIDSAVQELELESLLQLSQPKGKIPITTEDESMASDSYGVMAGDEQAAQVKAQDFVTFNQAYINELVKYWH